MQFYSATKKSKNTLFEGKLRQLKITLEELDQNQKDKYHMFSLVCGYCILYEDMKSLCRDGRNTEVNYSGSLGECKERKGG